jgi:hypothetical protein
MTHPELHGMQFMPQAVPVPKVLIAMTRGTSEVGGRLAP